MVCRPARGQGAWLRPRPLLVQREGRPLRGLRRRRPHQDRDALPADVYVTCDVCKGKRYDRETLEVKFRDKSIADVLDMTVEEATELFRAVPSIREKLATLCRVGLDYVHVGQQATTLSGGEAQRVKLAKELSKRSTGGRSTSRRADHGPPFHDVAKLMELLHELADAGNTVVVIEHNLEVIKTADWVVDMGPEGGDGGGTIVAHGTPEDIARNAGSHTGRFLAQVLARRPVKRAGEAVEAASGSRKKPRAKVAGVRQAAE
jgi:excinuclease ABC subunit A